MNDRQKQFLAFYRVQRHKDQVAYYKDRSEEFEKARNQAIYVSACLMILTALTSVTTDLIGPKWVAVLGVFFPALSAAFTAYNSLYSFEQQSKIYQDAIDALGEAESIGYDAEQATGAESEIKTAAYVSQIEEILRREQGQWGQLVSEIKLDVNDDK